jgi:hypothetical protein
MGLDRKASAHDQNDANDPKATSLSAIGPSAPRKAEGSLEAFGEVCHRLRRPTTTATAPDYRLSLNAEERGSMATQDSPPASRHNPVLRPFYERLIANGKPPKLALIAVLRRLVVFANAVLRSGQPWRGASAT